MNVLIFQLKRTVSRLPTRTMIHVQISRTMKSRTGCTCPSTFLLFPPSFFPYKDRGIEEWLSPQLARKKVPSKLSHTLFHTCNRFDRMERKYSCFLPLLPFPWKKCREQLFDNYYINNYYIRKMIISSPSGNFS